MGEKKDETFKYPTLWCCNVCGDEMQPTNGNPDIEQGIIFHAHIECFMEALDKLTEAAL